MARLASASPSPSLRLTHRSCTPADLAAWSAVSMVGRRSGIVHRVPGRDSPRARCLADRPVYRVCGHRRRRLPVDDGGQIWVPYNNGILTDAFVTIATDPEDPSTVYAGTDGGIWRSFDGGATWSYSETGLEWNTTRVRRSSSVPSTATPSTSRRRPATTYPPTRGELWTQFYSTRTRGIPPQWRRSVQ